MKAHASNPFLTFRFCCLESLTLFLRTLPSLTWKSLLCVVARIPVHSVPGLAVYWHPPPFTPHSPFLNPQRFPLLNACSLKTTLWYLLHIVRYNTARIHFRVLEFDPTEQNDFLSFYICMPCWDLVFLIWMLHRCCGGWQSIENNR